MDFMRRSRSVSKLDHVRNEEIKKRMGMEKDIIDEVEKKWLQWYGHMRRMDDDRWPKRIWDWKSFAKRKRGRPLRDWNIDVKEAMNSRRLEDNDWERKDYWRLECEFEVSLLKSVSTRYYSRVNSRLLTHNKLLIYLV